MPPLFERRSHKAWGILDRLPYGHIQKVRARKVDPCRVRSRVKVRVRSDAFETKVRVRPMRPVTAPGTGPLYERALFVCNHREDGPISPKLYASASLCLHAAAKSKP